MKIILEKNNKLGHGYQIHAIQGPLDKTYDEESLDLVTAGAYAKDLLDSINREQNSNYKLEDVLCVTDEALEANKKNDIMSMKFWKDTHGGDFQYMSPVVEKNGEPEVVFTTRGVIGISFVTWKNDGNEKAKSIVIRYCQLLAAKGYGKGATEIWEEVNKMSIKEGIEWIDETFDKYKISGDSIMDMFAK